MKLKMYLLIISFFFCAQALFSQSVEINVGLKDKLGPMKMEQIASLGQGAPLGLNSEPLLARNVEALKALQPAMIRLFVLNSFNMFPKRGSYNFNSLDTTVSAILQTGAKPQMAITFKPRWLFPDWEKDSVHPSDYRQWEEIVYRLVKHCSDKGYGIEYWEVGNEPDGENGGGIPYHFTPENYVRYYKHTSAAILRADPNAKVGGPSLGSWNSPILPALLKACSEDKLPLSFVSWHVYTDDPLLVHEQILYIKDLLSKYPDLKPETILNEWNVWVPESPEFQSCYIAETIWQMKDAGLDWSCYYQISDWYAAENFTRDLPDHRVAPVSKFFNRGQVWFGLFDLQNQMRPTYFAFKLLTRMTGERLRLETTSDKVHGFATDDSALRMYNLMIWNFSDKPVVVNLNLTDIPKVMSMRQTILDAAGPGILENQRLRPGSVVSLKEGNHTHSLELEPWGVQYWAIDYE